MSVTRGQCDARPTVIPLSGTKLYCLETDGRVNKNTALRELSVFTALTLLVDDWKDVQSTIILHRQLPKLLIWGVLVSKWSQDPLVPQSLGQIGIGLGVERLGFGIGLAELGLAHIAVVVDVALPGVNSWKNKQLKQELVEVVAVAEVVVVALLRL